MQATRSVASNRVVRYVADALRFYMEFHASYDGFYGAFIHDPLAVAAALDPALVTTTAVDGRRRARRDADDRRDADRLARRLGSAAERRRGDRRPTRRRVPPAVRRARRQAWRRRVRRSTLGREGGPGTPRGGRARTHGGGRMASSWTRALVGIVAFLVVLVIGINVTGSIDRTPDPKTGAPSGSRTVIVILAIALLVGLIGLRRHRICPDQAARVDHVAVRHADDRPDPDRDRDQHHPGPDGLGGPQGAGLPRLDRDDPRRCSRRADRRRADRWPREPDLDLRPPGAVPLRLRRAVLHRRRRDRPAGRDLRPARLLPEPPEHADEPSSPWAPAWSSPSSRVIGYYGFMPFYTNGQFTFFAPPAEGATGPDRSS